MRHSFALLFPQFLLYNDLEAIDKLEGYGSVATQRSRTNSRSSSILRDELGKTHGTVLLIVSDGHQITRRLLVQTYHRRHISRLQRQPLTFDIQSSDDDVSCLHHVRRFGAMPQWIEFYIMPYIVKNSLFPLLQ